MRCTPSTAAARTRLTSASSHDAPKRRRSVTKQRTGLTAGRSEGRPLLFLAAKARQRRRIRVRVAGEKQGNQLDEAGGEIDEAKPGHRATYEVVPDDRMNERHRFGKVVSIPERRPRNDEQRYSELEEERDDDQPFHWRWLSARWARDRYMMRVLTSRYPSASASSSIRTASARADSPCASSAPASS